jgi:hypothetical protein
MAADSGTTSLVNWFREAFGVQIRLALPVGFVDHAGGAGFYIDGAGYLGETCCRVIELLSDGLVIRGGHGAVEFAQLV